MIISRSMNPHVVTASPMDSLKSAAQLMEEHDFDALPICQHGRLVGMLTIRDIAIKAIENGLSLERTPVSQCMTYEAKYVFADQTTAYVTNFMIEQQLKCILVLDRDYELVGVVSLDDLLMVNQISETCAMQDQAADLAAPDWTSKTHQQNSYQELAA